MGHDGADHSRPSGKGRCCCRSRDGTAPPTGRRRPEIGLRPAPDRGGRRRRRRASSWRPSWATRFGRRREAAVTLVDRTRTHLWKPLLHEVAAGSMDVDEHELDYLAQAHWHHFRYRYGEMVGLDRAKQGVILAPPTTRTAGRSRSSQLPLRHAGDRGRQLDNDFGTPGVKEHAIALDQTRPGGALQPAPGQRLHPRARPEAGRCGRGSCTSRSSAPARPGPSCRPNCTAPPGPWSPTASTGSIRRRTSRSP